MSLPGQVLGQEHLARPDLAYLTVAGGDADAGVQVDDVLPAGRRVPVELVLAGGLTEEDAGGRLPSGALRRALLGLPFDLEVGEMAQAVLARVEMVDSHRASVAPPPRAVPGHAFTLVPAGGAGRGGASRRRRSSGGSRGTTAPPPGSRVARRRRSHRQ